MNAVQDEAFFQSQFLRAITLQLGAAGFDSATPSAMEALRAQAEECAYFYLSFPSSAVRNARFDIE
jgi:hypothetical protein